jgi:hypothetical protein
LDLKYNLRGYLFVGVLLLFGPSAGVNLMTKHALWERLTGSALLIASMVPIALVVVWLARPVDEEALQDMMRRRQANRISEIWKDYRRKRSMRTNAEGHE